MLITSAFKKFETDAAQKFNGQLPENIKKLITDLEQTLINRDTYFYNQGIAMIIGGLMSRGLIGNSLNSSTIFLAKMTGYCLGFVVGHDINLGHKIVTSRINYPLYVHCDSILSKCTNVPNADYLHENFARILQQEIELIKAERTHYDSLLAGLGGLVAFVGGTTVLEQTNITEYLANLFGTILPHSAAKFIVDEIISVLGFSLGAAADVFIHPQQNALAQYRAS
jgi:hypothetical protein